MLSRRSYAMLFSAIAGVASSLTVSRAFAEDHTTGVPVLNSRPGAAYTIYLDPSGFNYVGAWNGTDTTDPDGNPTGGMVPGYTPPLDDVSATGTFNANQQTAIKTIWARVAQSYIGMNVNVTTVDPAVAAGQASTDTLRRNYYDATPNIMHTVLGDSDRAAYVTAANPSGNWLPGADGVSPGIGVVAGRVDGPNALQGQHTNFMFAQAEAAGGSVITTFDAEYIGGISAHENAHSFGLLHQGDYTGGGVNHVNEYSFGDDRTTFQQTGTYVPIIGDGNSAQRIAWRVGTDDQQNANGVYQQENDLKVMLATDSAAAATAAGRTGAADLHFIEDGNGHTRLAATPLSLMGSAVDLNLDKGVIVPTSESNPNPMGAANYTTDWFSFLSNGTTPISLTANDSTDLLTPGVADDDGTLRSTLTILGLTGNTIGTATEAADTLSETYAGLLPAGTYYAEVGSYGGHAQVNAANYDPAEYFDTGAFFLNGSGFATTAVPEPTSIAALLLGGVTLVGRRRRSNA